MDERKTTTIVVASLFVILLIGSIGLFYYQKQHYSSVFFEYSGFAVHKVQEKGLSEFQIQIFINENRQPFSVSSRYSPRELEDIPTYEELRNDLVKEKLYITMEPTLSSKATIAFSEIDKYTENPLLFNLPTFPALIRKVEENDLPVILCDQATETVGVLMFRIGSTNAIYPEGQCVIAEAVSEDDLIRVADRVSLTLLNIMKP